MTRLTEEMVAARSRNSDLTSVKKLNCWGSDLSDVSIVRKMRSVEVLALSVNNISSLQGFEDCRNLQELYLRKNNIADLNEIGYLQSLPYLRNLWLEENPCCSKAGPNYRAMVLRALPNLKKLDNIDVSPEEVQDALKMQFKREEPPEEYEDARENVQQQTQPISHSPPLPQQQQQQQCYNQQPQQQVQPPQQQYQMQQRRSQSPRESQQGFESTEDSTNEPMNPPSVPSSPLQQTTPNQEFSTAEPVHSPSPKFTQKDQRVSYQQQYDKSPGSDQEGSPLGGNISGGGGGANTSGVNYYRDRGPIPPSISTQSMKEYYQSEYQKTPHAAQYRHSQTDLTDWEDHHQQQQQQLQHHHQYNNNQHNGHHQQQKRNGGPEREPMDNRHGYRNGNTREKEDWEEYERQRRDRRTDGRFNDAGSVVSSTVFNHYVNYHRRPVNRSSNLLSATLCLVKELDYPSLEVVEHAVRCRIDELSAE